MERLTRSDRNKVCYDPWELCGMDSCCTKSRHEEGGCMKGCFVLQMYMRLAALEDAGFIYPPLKLNDTVYELCTFDDGTHKIFPMQVKNIVPWGSPRMNGKLPETWNIYAEDQSTATKMYKSFYDIGRTVFITYEEAEYYLEDLERKTAR